MKLEEAFYMDGLWIREFSTAFINALLVVVAPETASTLGVCFFMISERTPSASLACFEFLF